MKVGKMAETPKTQTQTLKWDFSANSFRVRDNNYYAILEMDPEARENLYWYLDATDVLEEYGQRKLRSLLKLFANNIIEITIFEEREFKPRAKVRVVQIYDKELNDFRKILEITAYRKNPMYDYEDEFTVVDYSPDAVDQLYNNLLKLANDEISITDLLNFIIARAKEIVINY